MWQVYTRPTSASDFFYLYSTYILPIFYLYSTYILPIFYLYSTYILPIFIRKCPNIFQIGWTSSKSTNFWMDEISPKRKKFANYFLGGNKLREFTHYQAITVFKYLAPPQTSQCSKFLKHDYHVHDYPLSIENFMVKMKNLRIPNLSRF
jgi:hypothetical protein